MRSRTALSKGGAKSGGLLGVIDQGFYSLSSAGLVFFVARALSSGEFGKFASWHLVLLLTLALSRAGFAQPIAILYSTDRERLDKNLTHIVAGTLSSGALATTLAVLVAVTAGAAANVTVLLLAIPVVVAQDTMRVSTFAAGEPAKAVTADFLWLAAQVVGSVVAERQHVIDPSTGVVLAWAFGATLSLGMLMSSMNVSLLQARMKPFLGWWAENKSRIRSLGAYAVASEANRQMVGWIILLAFGTEILGGFRASLTLIGPALTLAQGMSLAMIPAASVALAKGRPADVIILVTSVAASGAAILAGTFVFFLPDNVGMAFVGETWTIAHELVPATTIYSAAQLLVLGPFILIMALDRADRLVKLRVLTALTSTASLAAAVLFFEIEGSLLVLSLVTGLVGIHWWREPRRILGNQL